MISEKLKSFLNERLKTKREDGTYKQERIITSPQRTEIHVKGMSGTLLNFCANNYLGLADNVEIKEAAQESLKSKGFGMASVRFICGTQDIHKKLERAVSKFLNTGDSILFTSCFDANGGLFESFLTPDDVIISSSLNHASIIDGVRLCKAGRKMYHYDDMGGLEKQLNESKNSEIKVVVTDGVFSMEGDMAPLDKIVPLCEKYGALLVVDDSHATGFIGQKGRGTGEHFGVHDSVDLYTSTFGKALGGASGGYISGKGELIEWFRNTSRPYLFSNSLAPSLAAGTFKALEIVSGPDGDRLRKTLMENTRYFREEMKKKGFNVKEGIHPIVPIMLGDAKTASGMAEDLLKDSIYVIGFSYPVVPKGTARIRVQISAAHSMGQLERAVAAFEKHAQRYGVL